MDILTKVLWWRSSQRILSTRALLGKRGIVLSIVLSFEAKSFPFASLILARRAPLSIKIFAKGRFKKYGATINIFAKGRFQKYGATPQYSRSAPHPFDAASDSNWRECVHCRWGGWFWVLVRAPVCLGPSLKPEARRNERGGPFEYERSTSLGPTQALRGCPDPSFSVLC